MFTGTSLSILNYDQDIYSLVKSGLVNVYIDEIDHLSAGKVHLASGTVLSSDVLVANTGWIHVPNVKLLPESIAADLGVPCQPDDLAPKQLAKQQALIEKADKGMFIVFVFRVLTLGVVISAPTVFTTLRNSYHK